MICLNMCVAEVFFRELLEGRTTFLLVGDGDSHEFTKKYRDARAAGVPIVHVSESVCIGTVALGIWPSDIG